MILLVKNQRRIPHQHLALPMINQVHRRKWMEVFTRYARWKGWSVLERPRMSPLLEVVPTSYVLPLLFCFHHPFFLIWRCHSLEVCTSRCTCCTCRCSTLVAFSSGRKAIILILLSPNAVLSRGSRRIWSLAVIIIPFPFSLRMSALICVCR